MRQRRTIGMIGAIGGVVIGLGGGAALGEEVLPKPQPPFQGKVDASRDASTPDWPKPVTAPAGAPNVVLVLLDDVGFAASRTFGGTIAAPALESLAREGLKYNNVHVNAMCSPTRAALLTGRNSHQAGFGPITESSAGYPGHNGILRKDTATIARVLRDNGYSTAAFGKWHNTPPWEISAAGPFERWPTGVGFEYFYGFLGAATSQWEPQLYRNTQAVEPGKTPEQGYHLTEDLAADAIKWLHQHDAVAPDKPFFLYFATGGTHSPHHVPKEWIEKYKGKFDQGWDKLREETFARQKALGVIPANAELTPRPKELPAWDSLSPEQKALFARQAEVYAAFLEHTDHQVGRLLDAIAAEGKSDNTLVVYIAGDNGATAEGGLSGSDGRTPQGGSDDVATQLARADQLGSKALSNIYAGAWGWALNAPFPWTKQVASHLGGTTDPVVISWPKRIKDKGGLRPQYHHVIDIAPTVYEAAGITAPDRVDGVAQTPIAGTSLVYTFDHPEAASHRTVQYSEMVGNVGIYKDGWQAGRRFLLPWESARPEKWAQSLDQNPWELYDLRSDFSQAHDLAATYPEKLKELQAAFDAEARRYAVYPIAPYRLAQPSPAAGKTHFVYREGVERLPLRAAPSVAGRAHAFTATVEIPKGGANGVIFAEGGRYGGFALYVKDGRVVYDLNILGRTHETIVSDRPLPAGRVTIGFTFTPDDGAAAKDPAPGRSIGPGTGRLTIAGAPAGEAHFAWFGSFGNETFDVGKDLGSPVSDSYQTPNPFTGTIETVTLDLL